MPLNERQVDQLFKPLNSRRVKERQGMSYLQSWDVIAHLNRIFGFGGWDKAVTEAGLLFEDENASKWTVAYKATVRLSVKDPGGAVVKVSEDVATGSAKNQPSRADAHDQALKSAVSDALKRAAKDLGNQFGLSLSDGGSLQSVVGTSLAYDPLEEPDKVTPPEEVRERVAGLHETLLGEREPAQDLP
jgi:DNA recombination protein Rad52